MSKESKMETKRSQSQSSMSASDSPAIMAGHTNTCVICHGSFDDNDKICIQCDSCQNWYHAFCVNLTDDQAKFIAELDAKGVKWFCKVCANANSNFDPFLKSEKRFSNIEKKLEQMSDSLAKFTSKPVPEFPSKEAFSDIVKKNVESYHLSIAETITKNSKSIEQTTQSTNQLLEKQAGILDSQKRRNFAILHGISEEDLEEGNGWHHQSKLAEILEQISFPGQKIMNFYRLGGKVSGKARPIKLKFEDENQKWDFIKRINAEKIKGVFAKLDLPQSERNAEFALREKVRKIKEKNPQEAFKLKKIKISM